MYPRASRKTNAAEIIKIENFNNTNYCIVNCKLQKLKT